MSRASPAARSPARAAVPPPAPAGPTAATPPAGPAQPAAPAPAPLGREQAQPLLRALADPIRLQVIEALRGGERCVCELTGELGLAQSKLSFHLRVMREAGLITARQQGRWSYHRLRPEALELLRDWLLELASGCDLPAPPCC